MVTIDIMDLITIFVAACWSLRLLINLFCYVHLWYVKEYRWDRMWIHLHTKQGKRILFPALRRPLISPKSITLTIGSFLLLVALIFFLPFHLLLRFLISDLLLFPMTGILVAFLNLPTKLYHEAKIFFALQKLQKHEPMMVIGITGSFGKTSTKEYLATILSKKFNVLKTDASRNSPIGIAETILEKLRPEHDVFIVEMGAYKRGEIARMAEMVKPQIGIVTAINPQHQDLFGTIETTMKAKYELIQGLVGKKIAIFNSENEYTRQMAHRARKDGYEVWLYSKNESRIKNQESRISFFATDVKATLKGINFFCIMGKKKVSVKASVPGEHQVSNILAAVAGAVAAGIGLANAAKAASLIKPFTKTLEPIPGIDGSMFINDTFNNNPDAAMAALSVLNMANGRKIMVFQPMIELGSYTEESHREAGAEAARVCDDIILTNNNFLEYFLQGVRSVDPKKIVKVLSAQQAAQHIRSVIKKGDTVLFKGKEAERVLRYI